MRCKRECRGIEAKEHRARMAGAGTAVTMSTAAHTHTRIKSHTSPGRGLRGVPTLRRGRYLLRLALLAKGMPSRQKITGGPEEGRPRRSLWQPSAHHNPVC